ncbi:MAG: hypothetical protein ABLT11_00435, partial [Candidatus Acidiferrum sp.]
MLSTTARFLYSMLVAIVLMAIPTVSYSQVAFGISVTVAPPELPYYEQPSCPGEGYIWTPGYWAYGGDEDDYYWVPGTWVLAPRPGYLWTPAYWGWDRDLYVFHTGYWGEHVGFYGGINYGYGYGGYGYEGGYWNGGVFNYNTAVNNVNTTVITNVYNQTVINNNVTVNNISYNGGNGGITAQPTATQLAAARERHVQPTTFQVKHEGMAKNNPSQYVKVNAGKPAVAATPKPGVFQGRGIIAAAKVDHIPQRSGPATANTFNNTPNARGIGKAASGNSADRRTKSATRPDRPFSAQLPVENNSNRRGLDIAGSHRASLPNQKSTMATTTNRSDRPPSVQRSLATNPNMPNRVMSGAYNNRPVAVDNRRQSSSTTARADRPPFAQHNTSSTTTPSEGTTKANGLRFNDTANRPYSPQRNDRFASPQRNDRSTSIQRNDRFASPQRNDRPTSIQRNDRLASPQRNDRPTSIQRNDRLASPQYNHSAKAENFYRAPSSRPSNPDVRSRNYQPLPQRQSPNQYQHAPPQRQSAPPQRQSSPPQRQSSPPQR